MNVKDIMTSPVITTREQTSSAEVAELLRDHRISAVPIVDDAGAVVGVVSEHDLISKRGETAAEIMSSALISVTEDTDVDDVRLLLAERRIRLVPVMAGSKLLGVISRSNLVALMAMEWVCQVCGEPARGGRPPADCPRCAAPATSFAEQQQSPRD